MFCVVKFQITRRPELGQKGKAQQLKNKKSEISFLHYEERFKRRENTFIRKEERLGSI
jgi:hypothetical protein